MQIDAASTLHVRPHSWTLSLAMGAVQVLDLDPLTKYRTVVTRKTRARWSATPAAAGAGAGARAGRRSGGPSSSSSQQQQQQMLVVGDFRVPKNADLTVDFNPGGKAGGHDVAVTCRVLPFEVFYRCGNVTRSGWGCERVHSVCLWRLSLNFRYHVF